MTHSENIALEYAQQTAGLHYGQAVAALIIAKWPDGFSHEVGDAITIIVDNAVSTYTETLKVNGVKKRFRLSFETAYYIAVRNAFAEYASDCSARAMKAAA